MTIFSPGPRRGSTRRASVFAVLLFCLGGFGQSVMAADYPPVIKTLTEHGIRVEKSFPAASGLTGWVITDGRQYSVVYSTSDGQSLLHGNLIDARGINLTAIDAQKHVPKPDYTEAWGALDGAASITEGTLEDPKRIIYVFFDPNCPFCHAAWMALQVYEQKGLQVKWVPVAYLRESSAPKAAAMLEAKDPPATFRTIMQGFGEDEAAWAGRTPGPESLAALKANSALMARFGFRGTPSFVYKDADGNVTVKNGMPKLAEFAEISGLPEQPQGDPRLAQFR